MKKTAIKTTLDSLVSIPSITRDSKACKEILKKSQLILRKQKILSRIIHTDDHLVFVWGETNLKKTRWLINSHLDVVPGKKEQFKQRVEKDKIFGRGTADTKGCITVLLINAQRWTEIAKTKHTTFMLVFDEETGGETTKLVLKTMPELKGAVFLEPTEEKIITKAKGIMQIKIQAVGKSSHGSRPWNGKNALEQLSYSLNSFKKMHPSPRHETKATTYNFSLLQAGTAINQVPAEATLWCDIRWNPDDNPRIIIGEFKKIFKKSHIEVVKLESPCSCPGSSTLFKSFSAAMISSKIPPKQGFEHSSSDARHCTARKIPAIVFGPKGNNLHADNEWVSLKSLERVSTVLNAWITQPES